MIHVRLPAIFIERGAAIQNASDTNCRLVRVTNEPEIAASAMYNGYVHTHALAGTKYFAIWPLAQAAESCFGMNEWPADVPAPQAWIEFDVEDD